MPSIKINGRGIGPGHPTYVVAEMSANHNRDFSCAVRILELAKELGADAVKLQTYTADTLTVESQSQWFRINGTVWDGRTLYDLYREASMPWEWQPRLKSIADSMDLDLFSTPFDVSAVEFLEQMDVQAYKVASFEIVDFPLLRAVAQTGKPVIVSTGMASLGEISEAVDVLKQNGCEELALLKCTSAYPAPPDEMNLKTVPHLSDSFGVPVGISDHTQGSAVSIAAVTLGACIVEKHLTLSRAAAGPDSGFSADPAEFRELVKGIRVAEESLGGIRYGAGRAEESCHRFRRSLFVVEDVRQGDVFSLENIRSIRPGDGLHTRYLGVVLGRCATRDIRRGTPLIWSLVGDDRKSRDQDGGRRSSEMRY
jgi:pseudaminic acid synthase